ncbi:receptor-type adenylate cyclase [Trypanosoma cruzi Dm28c]|uniref:Receptor-type adenylate cyclase n=1 Tax=Trypanosoma cruzi Dm28c TaxID=1416333 RepID=V5DC93_TRYCR|nr:receptor-type adenylate cyclase [Trypanosoma cruzi Dm28c]
MAARTESVGNGGQVLLTRAAYFALSTAEREQVEVTALGGVALRGVPEPVEMYQLDAVPGRTFAALRLDREMPDLDDGSDLASGDGSVSTERSVPSGYIASVLAVVFGTFSAPQRLEALLPLCQRWSVPVPSGDGEGREQDVCRVAMERLAAKVCSVLKKELLKSQWEKVWAPCTYRKILFFGTMACCGRAIFLLREVVFFGKVIGEAACARRLCPRRRSRGGRRGTRSPPFAFVGLRRLCFSVAANGVRALRARAVMNVVCACRQ